MRGYNERMYDPLTSTYSFACPHGKGSRVPLSSFRRLERLPGAAHPAVYRVLFVIELAFLDGRERLDGYDVHALVQY